MDSDEHNIRTQANIFKRPFSLLLFREQTEAVFQSSLHDTVTKQANK